MINFIQAQRLASNLGVPPEIIEKDYLIELILFYFGQESYLQGRLIFRGGTALKKVYIPNYRFSEDIDFLIEERESFAVVEEKIEKTILEINTEYPSRLEKRGELNDAKLQIFISYNIIPEIRSGKELKIDLLKDTIIPAFRKRKILFTYKDFKTKDIYINAYDLESVVSDKIGRILGIENEPRDLYDLWSLLLMEVVPYKIMKQIEDRFGYVPSIATLIDKVNDENFKRNWKIRLENQINNLPDFEVVANDLARLIKKKLSILE